MHEKRTPGHGIDVQAEAMAEADTGRTAAPADGNPPAIHQSSISPEESAGSPREIAEA